MAKQSYLDFLSESEGWVEIQISIADLICTSGVV